MPLILNQLTRNETEKKKYSNDQELENAFFATDLMIDNSTTLHDLHLINQ